MSDKIDFVLRGLAPLLVICLLPLSRARAQEVGCDTGSHPLPCSFQLENFTVEEIPPLFQFQSSLSMAKLPVGDTVFQTVLIKVLLGKDIACLEQLSDVPVKDGVINLVIGKKMTCDLGRVIAENPSVALQVCLGGPANCLKPTELLSAPFAVRANYASMAQQAWTANLAIQSSYALRMSSDRDMLLGRKLRTGYFDFYTHPAPAATALYSAAAYKAFADSGFIQWTPLAEGGAPTLHIAGKKQSHDSLQALDEVILVAAETFAPGNVIVDSAGQGGGLMVTQAGAHVTDDSDFLVAVLRPV